MNHPNNTFREEDKAIIIGGIVMSCGNIFNENGQEISAKVGEYMISEMEKQIHDSHKRLVEKLVGEIEQKLKRTKSLPENISVEYREMSEKYDLWTEEVLDKTIGLINQTLK